MGIDVGISLPSSVQAELQIFKVRGCHLRISTSGFFPFGRTTLPLCLSDPENVGIGFRISLLSCVQAEIYVFEV